MQRSITLFLTVLMIAVATVIGGCTGSGEPTTAENTPQTTQITAEATMTLADTTESQTEGGLKHGEQVSSETVVDRAYNWYEYRINTTSEMPPNGIKQNIGIRRVERSDSEYDGKPAILVKYSYDSKTQGWSSVSENFYDKSRNLRLCGTRIMTTKDNELEITIYPVEEVEVGNSKYFGKEITLTYLGTETVTVPAGAFQNAGKYFYSEDNFDYTYWFAAGIPVPVLVQFPHSGIVGYNGFESDELIGWG